MALIPMNGATTPPIPYIKRFLVKIADAPNGRYFTPFNAIGIKDTMINALKMIELKTALSGLIKNMIFRLESGPA